MVNRLKTLVFILLLTVSVFSGTPLQGGDMGMKKEVCPMKCCKDSAKPKKKEKANPKYLCRVLVCSQNMPTNAPSATQINLMPNLVLSQKTSLFEILFSTTPKENVQLASFETQRLKTSQPKYIQHKSLLI